MPIVIEVFKDEEFYFQQNGKPCTAIVMLDAFLLRSCQACWLDGGVSLNTISFHHTYWTFFGGYLKDRVYAVKPAIVAELRAAIERECTQIPRGLFCDVCGSIA